MTNLRLTGIGSLLLCVFSLTLAVERCASNASAVDDYKRSREFRSFNGPGADVTPATPIVTKYALFFALLTGGFGSWCLVMDGRKARETGTVAGVASTQRCRICGNPVVPPNPGAKCSHCLSHSEPRSDSSIPKATSAPVQKTLIVPQSGPEGGQNKSWRTNRP